MELVIEEGTYVFECEVVEGSFFSKPVEVLPVETAVFGVLLPHAVLFAIVKLTDIVLVAAANEDPLALGQIISEVPVVSAAVLMQLSITLL